MAVAKLFPEADEKDGEKNPDSIWILTLPTCTERAPS